MADSQKDALLVRSTIDLARGLGLKVTAEGWRPEAVLALLTGMGCDLVQGYLTRRRVAEPSTTPLAFLDPGATAVSPPQETPRLRA